MKITITFKTDNAAFEDDLNQAVASTLNRLALRISDDLGELEPGDSCSVMDYNGNKIGRMEIEE